MTIEEFTQIVKKFNEDKIKYNWIEIVNSFDSFSTTSFLKRIKPIPVYYEFSSGKEFAYWVKHSEESDFIQRRFCPVCGKFITTIHRKEWFYSRGCCPEHAKIVGISNAQQTNIEKYGGKSPMKSKLVQQKVSNNWKNKSQEEIKERNEKGNKTKLERYGNEKYNNRKQAEQTCMKRYGAKTIGAKGTIIRKKLEENNLQKFGCISPLGDKNIQEKIKNTNIKKYGVEYIGAAEVVKNKVQSSLKINHGGIGNGSKEIREKIEKTNIEKYGSKSHLKNKEIKEKINKTNLERYGVNYPLQNIKIHNKTIESGLKNNSYINAAIERSNWPQERKDLQAKRAHDTKCKNGTFNTSKSFEDTLIDYLKKTYPQYTIITQYYDDQRYPYNCDCYIKELDLFIEFQGSYFHNWRPFDNSEAHIQEYNNLIAKGGLSATVADTWRYRDVEKRKVAKENNLNYLEYWENLILLPEDIRDNMNNLVLYYQQNLFYEDAKIELYDPIKRWKYYQNAVKYSDFYKKYGYVSHLTLLRRPYISKLIGFSSFNIKLCEMIDKKYTVYDPCGGWGHRMLGFKNHKGYIYNDINSKCEINCMKMAKKENITNVEFYNQDAIIPINNEYDVVFTCPPYFNKELFTEEGAENYTEEEFIRWWNAVLNNLHPTTGEIYIVINSNYLKYFTTNDYKYEIISDSLRKSHYHKSSKAAKEIVIKFTKVI